MILRSADAEVASKNNLIFERQIQLYTDYAFAQNSRLKKFLLSPSVSIVCNKNEQCKQLSDAIAPLFPKQISLEVIERFEKRFEISLFVNKQEFEVAVKGLVEAADYDEFMWGDERCAVAQISNETTISHLLIHANPKEGLMKNSVCFVTELLKGSGGALRTDYDKFVSTFESSNFSEFEQFKSLTEVVLYYHWSTVLSPGIDRVEAEEKLRKFLKLEPKN